MLGGARVSRGVFRERSEVRRARKAGCCAARVGGRDAVGKEGRHRGREREKRAWGEGLPVS